MFQAAILLLQAVRRSHTVSALNHNRPERTSGRFTLSVNVSDGKIALPVKAQTTIPRQRHGQHRCTYLRRIQTPNTFFRFQHLFPASWWAWSATPLKDKSKHDVEPHFSPIFCRKTVWFFQAPNTAEVRAPSRQPTHRLQPPKRKWQRPQVPAPPSRTEKER